MKSLLVKLGVLFIGLAIFGNAEVWGADWKVLSITDTSIVYYDSESITSSPKSITQLWTTPSPEVVKVWFKMIYSDKGIIENVKNLGKEYADVRESKHFSELNCQNKKIRTLSQITYSKESNVVFSSDRPSGWSFIVPDSIGDLLYQAVCK